MRKSQKAIGEVIKNTNLINITHWENLETGQNTPPLALIYIYFQKDLSKPILL